MSFPNFITPLTPANFTVQRCPTNRRRAPQRILIVKFGALGDILMATPLLTALRRSYPDAHLTWLVEHGNIQAIDANPYVDEIMLWDSGYLPSLQSTRPRNWLKNRFGLRWLSELARLKFRLHRRFKVLISFNPEQWPLLLSAAAPEVSIGVFQSPRWAKRDYASRYTKAYTSRHTENLTALDFPPHQVDICLLPLNALGLPPPPHASERRMVMGYTAEDAEAVERLLGQKEIGPGFVVLAPKTTWESKCWPEERWSALGDALAAEGRQIVLLGTAAEGEALERVAAGMQSAPALLAKTLSFRQAAALIARASLCLSSDSGPMHTAAAVGTPYVSLFGPTPATRYAPLEAAGRVLLHPVPCGPCMELVCPNPPETRNECMRLLTISEVRDAARSILRGDAAGVSSENACETHSHH